MSDQINLLESAAKREEEKIEDLQLKCEMFSFGEFDEDDQAKLLKQFDSHVSRVYVKVIGDNEAQIPTLHMLISIENYLGNLLDQMEVLPAEVIAQYEKRFEKDRRARMREEKAKQQEMLQKETRFATLIYTIVGGREYNYSQENVSAILNLALESIQI